MVYLIGIGIALIVVFFVAIPLIKALFGKLVAALGNILAIVIGIGLIVLTIMLCLAFPPLIFVVVGYVLYKIYGKGSPKSDS